MLSGLGLILKAIESTLLSKTYHGGKNPALDRVSLVVDSGQVFTLLGRNGAGKTTFTQGFLKELGAKGPYISPTFLIMKHYRITQNVKRKTRGKKTLSVTRYALREIYHIDAYRVDANDILNLGWEEIISDGKNVVIIEWADRIRSIIPQRAIWLSFEWIDENKRKITVKNF